MALSGHFFFLNELSALFRPMIIFAKIVEELFHSNRCDCSFLLCRRVLNYFTAIFLSFFQHKRQYLVHESLRLPAKNVIRVWRNTEITEITEITSVNLKKAGMTSRHIVIEKQYTLF